MSIVTGDLVNAPTLDTFGTVATTPNYQAILNQLGFGASYKFSTTQMSNYSGFIAQDKNCSQGPKTEFVKGSAGPCVNSIYDGLFNNYAKFHQTTPYPDANPNQQSPISKSRKQLFKIFDSQYLVTIPVAGTASQEPYSGSINLPLTAGVPTATTPSSGIFDHAPAYMNFNAGQTENNTTSHLTTLFGNNPASGVILQDFHACPLVDQKGNPVGDSTYTTCIITSPPSIPLSIPGPGANGAGSILEGYRFATQQDYINADYAIYAPDGNADENQLSSSLGLPKSGLRGLSLFHEAWGSKAGHNCSLFDPTNQNGVIDNNTTPFGNCQYPYYTGLDSTTNIDPVDSQTATGGADAFYLAYQYSNLLKTGDQALLNPSNKIQRLVNIDDIYYSVNNIMSRVNQYVSGDTATATIPRISWANAGLPWSGFSLINKLDILPYQAAFTADATFSDNSATTPIIYTCQVLNHRNYKSSTICTLQINKGVGTATITNFDTANVDKGDSATDLTRYGDWAIQITAQTADAKAITAQSIVMPFAQYGKPNPPPPGKPTLTWPSKVSVNAPVQFSKNEASSYGAITEDAITQNIAPQDSPDVAYSCGIYVSNTNRTPVGTCSIAKTKGSMLGAITITPKNPDQGATLLVYAQAVKDGTRIDNGSTKKFAPPIQIAAAGTNTENLTWKSAGTVTMSTRFAGGTATGQLTADADLTGFPASDNAKAIYECALFKSPKDHKTPIGTCKQKVSGDNAIMLTVTPDDASKPGWLIVQAAPFANGKAVGSPRKNAVWIPIGAEK